MVLVFSVLLGLLCAQVQNCDSPLHIASKLGLEDVVKFLLSFSQTDLTVRDRDGKLACEVICNRGGSNQAKAAIRSLFEDIYFVSVVRSKDNSTPPRLIKPCGWEESFSPGQRNRPIDSECVNAAMAGPMSPSQAKDLYRRWKALRGESKAGMQMKEIMRMDPTKGMETVGRTLAQGMQVGWSEYWEFLDTRCDLSTPEGMDLLERHISTVSEHSTTPSTGDTPSARIATPPLNQHSGSSPTLSAAKESGKFRSVLPSRSESPFAVEGRRREVEEDSLDDLSGALKQILKFDDEPSTSTPEVSQRKSPREGSSSGGIEAEGGDVGMCCEPLLSPSTSTAATTCQSSEATERITGIQDATTATTGVKSNSEQQQRDAASKPDPVPFGPDQLLSSSSTGRLRLGVVGKDVRESPSECDPAVPITPDRDPALFCTPRHHRSGNGEQDLAFLMGSEPCKVDSEVLLALGSGEVDAQRYPRVASWQNTVSAYSQLDRKGWPSPRTADYRSVPRRPPGVPAIPLSPLVHSCSPSAYTKNLSSSRSSTPLTVSSSLHATPKRILQGSRMLEPRAI